MSQAQEEVKGEAPKTIKKKKASLHALHDPNSFSTYIFRVLKANKEEVTVSKKSMQLFNTLIVELFTKIMKESRDLALYQKKNTINTREIETATKLVLKGELRKQALAHAAHTLKTYADSRKN